MSKTEPTGSWALLLVEKIITSKGTPKEVEDWLLSRVIDIGIVILPNEEMEISPLTRGKWLW
ncbi:hypothetical protein bpmyx0001_16520 [Bacillus pseudomycoides DSM 12442]|nr:hypothetical protein bpmyx0001_16520 [Bacillus pseudomycoides DSM 12442]